MVMPREYIKKHMKRIKLVEVVPRVIIGFLSLLGGCLLVEDSTYRSILNDGEFYIRQELSL